MGDNKDELDILNWNVRIDKITNILNLLKMRDLTYYGKVVIIKVLVASQIVYTATAVRTPYNIIKTLNKLIYQFIWNSKKEKIKRNICINPITDGGLGMIDLDCKVRSLKLSWIHKYLNGPQSHWKLLFTYWMNKIGGTSSCFIYNCNLKDMSYICKKNKLPDFYTDLFCIWSSLKYVNVLKSKNISEQIIWNNSNIRFQNEVLLYRKWQTAGIVKVKHVFKNGRWMDPVHLNSFVGNQQLMFNFEFAKIKKAFPSQWIHALRNNNKRADDPKESSLIEIATGDLIDVNTTNVKQYYSLLVGEKQIMPSIIYSWEEVLQVQTEIDWKAILLFKFGKIFDNKLKQFNFKILHKIIPSKANLCKWKLLIDDICNVCNKRETTFHILLHCKNVTQFWSILTNLIYNLYKVRIKMNETKVIIGYDIKSSKFDMINIIIIFGQYVIYKNYLRKCSEQVKINTRMLYNEFKSTLKTFIRRKLIQNILSPLESTQILDIL